MVPRHAGRHEVQPVLALDDDRRRRERAVDVAVRELVAQRREVRRPSRRARAARPAPCAAQRIEDRGQLVVLDVDQLDAPPARSRATPRRPRRSRRGCSAPCPHLSASWSFTNPNGCCSTSAAVMTARTPGSARARVVSIRRMPRVGEPRAQDRAVRHPRQLEVVEEPRAPGDLLGAVASSAAPASR